MNDFIANVHAISNYFLKNIDFIDPVGYERARQKLYREGIDGLSDAEWLTIIMYGSHVGDVMRTAYYKIVHKRGIDPRCYWDAAIKALMFGHIWDTGFEHAVKDRRVKAIIQRTRYPKWTIFGLVGGNWAEIQREAWKFCEYMDELDAKEVD